MQLTRVCYGCKQSFRKEEMIEYASEVAIHAHWYCPDCLREKKEREMFSEKVCAIFGLKNPGPRIWKERKNLIDTYGYTDGIIIDCLDYIYNVKHYKKLSESLCLIKPAMVAEMKKYKSAQKAKSGGIIAAMKTEVEHVEGKIQENTTSNKTVYSIDEILGDD